MESKWFKKGKFYFTGLLLAVWLFSPFLAYLVEDWSHPVTWEKQEKPQEQFEAEQHAWEERKKQAEEQEVEFTEDIPIPYEVVVKWEIDNYSFNQHPKFFFSKLGLPWFPSTLIVILLYPFLLYRWLNLFIMSDLYHHDTAYSYLKKPFLVLGMFVAGCWVSGIIIATSTELEATFTNPEAIEAAKQRFSSEMGRFYFDHPFEMLLVSFIGTFFIIAVHDLGFRPLMKLARKHIPVFYKKIILPITGTRIKIRKSGKVIIRKVELGLWKLIPFLKVKTFKLTMGEFLYYQRKLLLGSVSSKFLKGFKDEITYQLKSRFLDLSHEARSLIEGGAIPKNLRFLTKKGNKTIIVIQEEPSIHSISFTPIVLEKEKKALKKLGRLDYFSDDQLFRSSFKLAFPYCIFVIVLHRGSFEDFYAYWSPHKINSLSDSIYQFGLPNIDETGHVCLGIETFSYSSMAKICEEVIESFWRGHFSYHMTEVFDKVKDKNRKIQSLYDWHEASNGSPEFMCGLSMNYVSFKKGEYSYGHYYNLSEAIQDFTKDEKEEAAKVFDDFIDDVLFDKPLSLELLDDQNDLTANPDQIFELIAEEKNK